MKRVYRYDVPIDDRTHLIPTTSDPLFLAARNTTPSHAVEFWAEFDDEAAPRQTRYTVVGTGHPVPPGAIYRGTTLAAYGLVWHLYEITPEVKP